MKINEVWIFDSLRFREFYSAQIICWLQWNTFAWTLLLVEIDGYPIFAALCHILESEFGIGLLLCVHLRWKYSKFCLKENHVKNLSALFSCNEPKTKSSVRYCRNCLQAEIRSYLYATWHSVVLKINEVRIFDTLRFREFCSAQIICRLQWNIFARILLLVEFDWYPIFAALCQNLGSEFGIGLLLCVHLRGKYWKFRSRRIMMSCVLDYSVAMNSSPTT